MVSNENYITSNEASLREQNVCDCVVADKLNFEAGSIKPLKTPKSSDEKGATMLEYGVMVALILVGSIAVVKSLGQNIRDGFFDVDDILAQSTVE